MSRASASRSLPALCGVGLLFSAPARAEDCEAFFAEARTWAADNGWTVAGAGTADEVRLASSVDELVALSREAEDAMLLVRIGGEYALASESPALRLSNRGPLVVCGEEPWEAPPVRAEELALLAFHNAGWTTAEWQYPDTGWVAGWSVAVHARNTRLWVEAASFLLPPYASGVLFEELPGGDPERELRIREAGVASPPEEGAPSQFLLHTCSGVSGGECGLAAPIFVQGVEWRELQQGALYIAAPVGLGAPVAARTSTELVVEDTELVGVASQLSGRPTVRALGAVTFRRSRLSSLRNGGVYSEGAVRLSAGTVVSDFLGSELLVGTQVSIEDSVVVDVSGFTTLLRATDSVSVSGSLLCGLDSVGGGSALLRWGAVPPGPEAVRSAELVSSVVVQGAFDTLAEAPAGSLLAANLTLGNLQGISEDQPLVLAADLPTEADEALFEEWRNVLFVDLDALKVTPDWGGSVHDTLRYWDSTLATGCSELGLPDEACETLADAPELTSGTLPANLGACSALAEVAVPLLRQAPGPLTEAQLGALPVLLLDQPALLDAGSDWSETGPTTGCEGRTPLDVGASGGSCAPWFLDPALSEPGTDPASDSGVDADTGAAGQGAYVLSRGCRWAGAVVLVVPLGLLRRRDRPWS